LKISFEGKNKMKKGLTQGAMAGLFTGLLIDFIAIGRVHSSGEKGILYIIDAILIIPASAILGAVVGGIIGYNTHEEVIYDLTKYVKSEKKAKVLNILTKHKLNF
jgi:hypothetical protein